MALGAGLDTWRSVPSTDADLGRAVGVKPCLRLGFARPEPSRVCA
jgi:hypothetical protein